MYQSSMVHLLARRFNYACMGVFLACLVGCHSQANQLYTNQLSTTNTQQDTAENKTERLFSQRIKAANILELNQMMEQGELTSVKLTQYYIDQIKQKNHQLNAIISINPKALLIAQERDKERAEGKVFGPLHGLPILLKDNIETESMPTTAGSLALKNNFTQRDAHLVVNLKKAGAIILGKTNLSEWANFRSERSASGWSAVGGQTRNPHDLSRSTCGSSSGSGAAIAAGLAVGAIGTETNGSITCPSSANGIVGLKPTVGLVSQNGIVPISHTQDTAGPMTSHVIDAAIILAAMQGKSTLDKTTTEQDLNFDNNYSIENSKPFLSGKTIGVVNSDALQHEAVSALLEAQISLLKAKGAIIIKDLTLAPYDGFYRDSYDVLLYEFKHNLNEYLASLPSPYNQLTLEQLIDFNKKNAAQEMPFFQQEIFEKSQAKGALTEKDYLKKLKKIREATRERGLDQLFKKHQLDFAITATLSPAWKIDELNGDHYTGGYAGYSAISGYPHLTIPMGKVHNMPVGMSLIGLFNQEHQLLKAGHVIEQATKNKISN